MVPVFQKILSNVSVGFENMPHTSSKAGFSLFLCLWFLLLLLQMVDFIMPAIPKLIFLR